jgi:hypothetical protein
MLNRLPVWGLLLVLVLGCASPSWSAPKLTLEQVRAEVETNAMVDVALQVENSAVKNPFTEASVTGSFQLEGTECVPVTGFCDSPDGKKHRIRFLPRVPGNYDYTLIYQEAGYTQTFKGRFVAKPSSRKGMLRVDPDHPYHFIWSGTKEHFFWNSTTAYWMLGLEDDQEIKASLDRLASLKINRIRIALCGRTKSGERWFEPQVVANDKFKLRLNPWEAARPDSVEDPGFDVTRFNIPHWQKCERLLTHARRLNIIVSLIFYLDGKDPGAEPFGKAHAGGDGEKRYYAYAASRFAAFPNVMWDICNEHHLMRDLAWVNTMGEYLRASDPYDHLTSVHGNGEFPFRTANWADCCLYQAWDQTHGGYEFMLANRQKQAATNQPKPQINEEYGYEDHYPQGWGGDLKAPSRDADSRRRMAWSISMAGGYQTTGERATKNGGWINGRGDSEMTMLKGYTLMADFFLGFDWWSCQPTPDVVKEGKAWCVADPGKLYAIYLPNGGTAKIALPDGKFTAELYDCQTGERKPLGDLPGGEWTSPVQPADKDWAILIRG